MAEVAPSQPSPWTVVARKDAFVASPQQPPRVFESLSSGEGVTVAVLDANALISTTFRLRGLADRFVTVIEAMEEVRDRTSRMQLAAVPVSVDCLEPTQEALTRVIQFARGTGDIQSLSDVDLKVMALTYTLEECAHGTAHLRSKPPPLYVTRVRPIQEHQLPGWGSNVPNLEEWEEISEEQNVGPDQEIQGESQVESHILGLKTLSLESLSFEGSIVEVVEDGQNHTSNESHVEASEVLNERQSQECRQSIGTRKARGQKKKEVDSQIEGKQMVAVGLDASKGEHEEIAGHGDWERAISRSTRRKYDKRRARAVLLQPSAQEKQVCVSDGGADESIELENETVSKEPCQSSIEEAVTVTSLLKESKHSAKEHNCGFGPDDEELMADDCMCTGNVQNMANLEHIHRDAHSGLISEGDQEDGSISETEQQSVRSTTECGTTAIPESEQSWILRPLSKSSVACITADFAMQNVLLQIGLRVLSPSGLQVHQLHRWALKCQACNTVTSEVECIFCPKCGNGGTLYKISVTVGENGIVHAGCRPRTNIRGTRYSLPLPKGGRIGAIENPILREDQIPHKLLHPKKKKASTTSMDLFTCSDTFTKKIDKGQRGPPIREALAVFSGKRNPNDCFFSRKH